MDLRTCGVSEPPFSKDAPSLGSSSSDLPLSLKLLLFSDPHLYLSSHLGSNVNGSGTGLVLIGPSGVEHTYALRLSFDSTNNEAEYEALPAGLRIVKGMNIQKLEAMVDSKLVASQINENYNILRNQNQKADVLSKLSSVAFNHLTKELLVEVLNELYTKGKEINTVVEEERENWMTSIIQCLEKGVWPKDKNEERPLQANYVIPEIHTGSYDMHSGPRTVFVNDPFKSWCGRLNIQQMNTVVAHPRANGLIERANKSLMEGIKTRLGREKAGWAVIPAEIGMPTYRTMTIREGFNEEEIRLNLDLLTKRRELVGIWKERYKTKLEQYYNKKVHRPVSNQGSLFSERMK
ncbi:reverse transcriptase domain-containing protein [Tanacetum coccineum]